MKQLRAIRRRVMTPHISATRLDVRGFHVKDGPTRAVLETVGASFLEGYGLAAEAREAAEAEAGLEEVTVRFRGFAYEGAAMAFAVRDALGFGSRRHVLDFLSGRAGRHVYMAYIGVGWAMARVPRFRWHRLAVPDPLLRWLVLDGYGFHQAYFKTAKYVHHRFHDVSFPWPAEGHAYVGRALDQGIGRALWFVGGADVDQVCRLLEGFPAARQPDLYSGAGLAATYAGGGAEAELRRFWDRAGKHRPQVAQGSAFAAAARVQAGLVVPHNGMATKVFCGMTPIEATKVTDLARRGLRDVGDTPAYEIWRQRIADELNS